MIRVNIIFEKNMYKIYYTCFFVWNFIVYKNFTFVSNDDSLDWKNYGVENLINTVVNHKHLGNGSIILCYNGAKYTAQALDSTHIEAYIYQELPDGPWGKTV